jgi:hypothetical protein
MLKIRQNEVNINCFTVVDFQTFVKSYECYFYKDSFFQVFQKNLTIR